MGSSTDLIAQKVEYVPDNEKRSMLMDLIHAQHANGIQGVQGKVCHSSFSMMINADYKLLWLLTGSFSLFDLLAVTFNSCLCRNQKRGRFFRGLVVSNGFPCHVNSRRSYTTGIFYASRDIFTSMHTPISETVGQTK